MVKFEKRLVILTGESGRGAFSGSGPSAVLKLTLGAPVSLAAGSNAQDDLNSLASDSYNTTNSLAAGAQGAGVRGELTVSGGFGDGGAVLAVYGGRGSAGGDEFAAMYVEPISLPVTIRGGRARFMLPAVDLGRAHFVLSRSGGEPLYGTLAARRLSAAHFPPPSERRTHDEQKTNFAAETASQAQDDDFSGVGAALFDIFPSGEGYADNAVASVNYYSRPISDDAARFLAEQNADNGDFSFGEPVGGSAGMLANGEGQSVRNFAGEEPAVGRANISSGRTAALADLTSGEQVGGSAGILANGEGQSARNFSGEEPADGSASGFRGGAAAAPGSCAARSVFGKGCSAKSGVLKSDFPGSVPGRSGYCDRRELRGRKLGYYERVAEQIDALFAEWRRDEALERLLPMTRWVRVDYSGDGRYYVVGLVGAKPDFVCYGLPAEFSPEPPEPIAGFCTWLPLDAADPHGNGYWLLCQDAFTGKTIPCS